MKTKFRAGTILFATAMLGAFGCVPVFVLTIYFRDGERLATGLLITLLIFSLLFIAGIAAIVWLTLQVEVDLANDTVTFHYPLRLQTFQYSAGDILGFRYKYLYGKVNYKCLKFKTRSDGRIFSISDFETANLRDLERLALEKFELRAGKEFVQLTARQKSDEIEMSKAFDFVQAKDIRFYMGLSFLSFGGFVLYLVYQMATGQVQNMSVATIAVIIMALVEYLVIRRFIEVHEQVKKGG